MEEFIKSNLLYSIQNNDITEYLKKITVINEKYDHFEISIKNKNCIAHYLLDECNANTIEEYIISNNVNIDIQFNNNLFKSISNKKLLKKEITFSIDKEYINNSCKNNIEYLTIKIDRQTKLLKEINEEVGNMKFWNSLYFMIFLMIICNFVLSIILNIYMEDIIVFILKQSLNSKFKEIMENYKNINS